MSLPAAIRPAHPLRVFKGCARVDMQPAEIRDNILAAMEGVMLIMNGEWSVLERGPVTPYMQALADYYLERPGEYIKQMERLGKAIPDVGVMITEPGDAGTIQSFGTVLREGKEMADAHVMPDVDAEMS